MRRSETSICFVLCELHTDGSTQRREVHLAADLRQMSDEAVKEYQATLVLDADFAEAHVNLGLSYLEIGRHDASAMLLAYPYAGLGETDRALDALDRAVTERAGLLIYLKVEPMFDRLRGERRFAGLMRRMQLAY